MKETKSAGCRITVADLRKWLEELPLEFQNAEVEAMVHHVPCTLKRIVAYASRDGSIGVVCNPMGTHLPFDDTLTWVKTLSP